MDRSRQMLEAAERVREAVHADVIKRRLLLEAMQRQVDEDLRRYGREDGDAA